MKITETPEQIERKIKKDIDKVLTAMEQINTDPYGAIGTLLLTATVLARCNEMPRAELFHCLEITWTMTDDEEEEAA